MSGLAVGPAVAQSGGRSSYGDELRLHAGLGTSDGVSLTTAEAQAMLRVTGSSQALNFAVGPAYTRWLGPSLVSFRAAPALGLARYDSVLFVDPSLTAAVGTGLVLGERSRAMRPWGLLPDVAGGLDEPRGYETRRRERTVLTLGLTGSVEALGNRPVLLAVGLLVGLSWFDERFVAPAPILPRPFLRLGAPARAP